MDPSVRCFCLLVIYFIFCCFTSTATVFRMRQYAPACECRNVRLCQPLAKTNSWEVVGFTFGAQVYRQFDWNKLTTIVVDGTVRSSLVCFAHSKGVKVHQLVVPNREVLTSVQTRRQFIAKTVSNMLSSHLDGINIDFEGGVVRNGAAYNGLTSLMKELRAALHKANKAYELTMDYRFCPFCDYNYVYDIKQIRLVVDYFVLMDYDLQGMPYSSKRWSGGSPCLTALYLSNSPLPLVSQGARQFLQAGIPGNQLVMALPWYGRSNACVKFNPSTHDCYVLCGKQFSRRALTYRTIMNILRTGGTEQGRVWRPRSSTPALSHFVSGQRYQVNYDDPVSLRMKWNVAVSLGFRGAGIWNIDFLDYSSGTNATADRRAMWGAIPNKFSFLKFFFD